jgi:hypothetical protein
LIYGTMITIQDLALNVSAKYKKPFLIYGETPMGRTTPWKICEN